MGAHIDSEGRFQSDKYPTCPPGKVPLSVNDTSAQDLLWEYAQRRRYVDAEFSADLEAALRDSGFKPQPNVVSTDAEFSIDSIHKEGRMLFACFVIIIVLYLVFGWKGGVS